MQVDSSIDILKWLFFIKDNDGDGDYPLLDLDDVLQFEPDTRETRLRVSLLYTCISVEIVNYMYPYCILLQIMLMLHACVHV